MNCSKVFTKLRNQINLKIIEIIREELDKNKIRSVHKETFKVHVKNQVKEAALRQLKTMQAGHSEIKYI